jgi:hypothetical protein
MTYVPEPGPPSNDGGRALKILRRLVELADYLETLEEAELRRQAPGAVRAAFLEIAGLAE